MNEKDVMLNVYGSFSLGISIPESEVESLTEDDIYELVGNNIDFIDLDIDDWDYD